MSVTGSVDFHSHLIPAVDDGAATVQQSLQALAAFGAQGAAACITTPHFDASITKSPRLFEQRLGEFDAGWGELTAAHATTAGLPAIHRGVELMLDDPDPLLNDERLRLAGGPFVLCEFPSMQLPPNAEWAVNNLRQKGWRPIIAHPERYRNHDAHMTTLARCRTAGAALQLNAGSLLGQHGDRGDDALDLGERTIRVVLVVELHDVAVYHPSGRAQRHAHPHAERHLAESIRNRVVEQSVQLRERRVQEHARDAAALRGHQRRLRLRARRRDGARRVHRVA